MQGNVRAVEEWTGNKRTPTNPKSVAVANTREKHITEVPGEQYALI